MPAHRPAGPRATLALSFLALILPAAAPAQSLPARLADTTFWRMVTDFSEPGGFFRSDNFVSNETSFQYVIPTLQRLVRPGSAYIGVAPDQNFTYIVALKPGIVFIVDIRHQNALQHLLYKAAMELSADRAEFLSRLFSRPRPAGLDSTSTVDALFRAYYEIRPDSTLFRRNFDAIKERLVKVHGFALTDDELNQMKYVYGAFYSAGPELTYNFGQGGGFRGGFGRMPDYEQLMLETDGHAQRSYVATEGNFRALKELEERNLIVPLTGNFAGDKALRAVGRYLREHGATVGAFYTSNVEQYLFQDPTEWKRFYANVATMPVDSTSTFIRSLSNGGMGFASQSPNSRQVSLLCPITTLLKAFDDGKIQTYYDMIALSLPKDGR